MLIVYPEPGANSYCTLEFANDYHRQNRLHNTAWSAATSDSQCAALVWATSLLNGQQWKGQSTLGPGSLLRFPRAGLTDRDGVQLPPDAIPLFIQNATAELARFLLVKDVTEQQRATQSIKIGTLDIKFADETIQPGEFPASVLRFIEPYIKGLNEIGMMRLTR